ncbi:MAG TPA: type II secretion system protein GspI, partial [Burkholderiaceae bacterium]|nr:type II secretion system protein GspI [Burkholderiaceae bacterium]
LIKVRLSKQMPGVGDSSLTCEQAGKAFNVTVSVLPTPNPSFRRVDAQVLDGASPILRLSTVVGRF